MKARYSFASACTLSLAVMSFLIASTPMTLQAASAPFAKGVSPALCGNGDIREPGIQGDVPQGALAPGQMPNFNCGVRELGSLPLNGNVQGFGNCAYIRPRASTGPVNLVHVVDTSDPARPVEVRTIPVRYGSETMRVVIARDRAILVSGSSVYDIQDCLNPVLLGEIKWPPLNIGVSPPLGGGGGTGILPHDLRVNRAGTKVYGSQGLWEVDISNLKDPDSWKLTDYRCDILTQVPGPWQSVHQTARKASIDLCEDAAKPTGAAWRMGGSSAQTLMMWPQLSHSPDVSGDGKLVFIADQAGGTGARISNGQTRLHIIDVTQRPVKVVGAIDGPGHGLDWFRTGGRDYVLHSNEVGTGPLGGLGVTGTAPVASSVAALAAASASKSDTCKAYPRPTALGWAFDALITEVTQPARPRHVARLTIAINDPEFCAQRKASNRDPTVAYHLIDNPMDAKFAMVNFGNAGLRFYDIRNPARPVEVAYFNHGVPVHGGIGHYDAARGLVYASGGGQFWILEIEPQVKARLGLAP
jgi:hypothetical protein